MKKNKYYILSLILLLTSCSSTSNSSKNSISTSTHSITSTSSIYHSSNINISSSSLSSDFISTSTSKLTSSSTATITTSTINKIDKNFVESKLNDTINNSYTLNYNYQGIEYNDIYNPNLYYYNDMHKQGNLIANLYGEKKYTYDFVIKNGILNITNQSYGTNGNQGISSLNYISLADYDYTSISDYLIETEKGIKIENRTYVDFFTYAINDYNSFDYIIFNKINDDLTIDFYYQDQLYDGYSYILKNIGTSNQKIIDSYLNKMTKFEINGSNAIKTFENENLVIEGDINYSNGLNYNNWETIKNIKIHNDNIVNYELTTSSNGVKYRQLFQKQADNSIIKLGLNGNNEVINSLLDINEEDIYPIDASFLNECFLINENEYIYLGSHASKIISSILTNMSSIVIDSWIKEIRFKIIDNKISNFSFNTYDINLEGQYVYFEGNFSILHNGEIDPISSLAPSINDEKIKSYINELTKNNANYTMESISYNSVEGDLIQSGEKHIINFVDNVYFDANYRINNDNTIQLQFGNGYVIHNDKVYSFRYDATINKVDNIKETAYSSIGEAILSLSTEVLNLTDDYISVNSLVTDISENVLMLEQSRLIDPQTLKFHIDTNNNIINKISYKYGNSYTSAYVEVPITYGTATIDAEILTKLNEAFPKDIIIEEKYLKDSLDQDVLDIYKDLYDYAFNEKADYIPYIPGIENCIDIIWINDNPEGYQYLIADAPSDYLQKFKDALIDIYGYKKISDNIYKNIEKGLQLEIKEDYGYQQFYFVLL